jgi:hypothetical protein
MPIPRLRESAHGATQQHIDDRQNPAIPARAEAQTKANLPALLIQRFH